MKKLQFFTVLILTTLLLGCGTTDDNPVSSNGSPSSDDVMNADGQYDGVWGLVSEHSEYGYNDYKFNEIPEMNFFDIDSGTDKYSDTSFLISLNKNSATLYMFDPEENPDTFLVEYMTLADLDEIDTEAYEESDAETLKSSLKSRFSLDSIGEITNFTVESIDEISSSDDTLIITFGFHVSANFTVFKNDEMITGSYECEFGAIYKLKKYSGALPPDSWPEDYVEEFNDDDEDEHNDDENEINTTPLNSWRLILLPSVSPTIQDSIEIALTIYEEFSGTSSTGVDTVYVLLVSQITSTSPTGMILLYESYGNASVINGNVEISGIFCKLLNPTTQEMEYLSSDICDKPISLPTTKLSKYEWRIPGEVITSFPFFTEDQKSDLSDIEFHFLSPNYDDM